MIALNWRWWRISNHGWAVKGVKEVDKRSKAIIDHIHNELQINLNEQKVQTGNTITKIQKSTLIFKEENNFSLFQTNSNSNVHFFVTFLRKKRHSCSNIKRVTTNQKTTTKITQRKKKKNNLIFSFPLFIENVFKKEKSMK